MIRIEAVDVERAQSLLENEGPTAMYDYLAGKGDRYATLANGVARGDSVAGVAAISFMSQTAKDSGTPLQEADIDRIRVDMAVAYLDVLKEKSRSGVITNDIKFDEAWAFHNKTFTRNGLPEDAWTLNAVFNVLRGNSRDTYWQSVLSAAGNVGKEGLLSVETDRFMSLASAIAPERERRMAQYWISRVDSTSGLATVGQALPGVLFNSVKGFISDVIGSGSESSTTPSLEIDINSSPQPRQHIQGEDQIRDDVSAGFVNKQPTHSIAFNDGTLNKTDFTSVQMGSFATGGIRPGELQLDPNVRPNAHLSQFYREGSTEGPDFSLRNAVVLNGLAAMTTVNTYVDPLLLDLSGNGVGMTPIEEGVLFDIDNSGALRGTGWPPR